MHTTLYRKYRPKNFEEVTGEADIIRTIKNSLDNNRMSHAYLFCGPRGVGKTTTARLIAKGMNCITNGVTSNPCNECENCKEIDKGNFPDLIEIDAASNRGIDEIRDLIDKINYQPSKGRKKIYIIDEVHMLTKEAFNALLKTLEEPPKHVIFILATTEPDKILPTIISRCQRYDFGSISLADSKARMLEICKSENIKIDEESLELIYASSGGSMRDAISLLEKIIVSCLNEEITEEKTSKIIGITSKALLKEFYDIVEREKISDGVEFLNRIWIDSLDIDKFFRDFANYLKNKIFANEIDTKKGLSIIGSVYDSLNKFKFEEDKRLLGYVVLNGIIKSSSKPEVEVREVIKEKVIYKESNSAEGNLVTKETPIEISFTIDYIKENWKDILLKAQSKKPTYGAFLIGASPWKIEDGALYINFHNNLFAKEQMEGEYYGIPFQDVVQEFTNSKIKIKCMAEKERETTDNSDEELVSKIVDFFSES